MPVATTDKKSLLFNNVYNGYRYNKNNDNNNSSQQKFRRFAGQTGECTEYNMHKNKSPIRFPLKTKREKYLCDLIANYSKLNAQNNTINNKIMRQNVCEKKENNFNSLQLASTPPCAVGSRTKTTYTKTDRYFIHYPVSSDSSSTNQRGKTVKLTSYKLV